MVNITDLEVLSSVLVGANFQSSDLGHLCVPLTISFIITTCRTCEFLEKLAVLGLSWTPNAVSDSQTICSKGSCNTLLLRKAFTPGTINK